MEYPHAYHPYVISGYEYFPQPSGASSEALREESRNAQRFFNDLPSRLSTDAKDRLRIQMYRKKMKLDKEAASAPLPSALSLAMNTGLDQRRQSAATTISSTRAHTFSNNRSLVPPPAPAPYMPAPAPAPVVPPPPAASKFWWQNAFGGRDAPKRKRSQSRPKEVRRRRSRTRSRSRSRSVRAKRCRVASSRSRSRKAADNRRRGTKRR